MELLPTKPSDLLALAIAHLEDIEKDPRYVVDMGVWHTPAMNAGCAVCLAGAVMVKGLGFSDRAANVGPSTFGANENRLLALNTLRSGHTAIAFDYLGLTYESGSRFARELTPYEANPQKWKEDMAGLERDLREAGY